MRTLPFYLLVALACGGASTTPTTPAPAPVPAAAEPAPAPVARGRPNILFVLVDDLNMSGFDEASGLKPLLQDQGTTFDNAYVSVSICCPSRASMLRGQYGHNTGVMHTLGPNGGFRGFKNTGCESSTVATWLNDQGYQTGLFGKYFNGYPFADDTSYVPPGWDYWAVPGKGEGYSSYNYSLNVNGQMEVHGQEAADHITDVVTGHAESFIRAASAADQPFLAWVAHFAPHVPATPPPRYQGAVTGKAPRSTSFNESNLGDKPPFQQSLGLLTPAWEAGIDEVYRHRRASMLGVVDSVDRMIKVLTETGELDNTWIVFMSDNGYHMGEHRLPWGKNTAYEEDINVPLVVRGPGVPKGARVSSMVLNADIAVTFSDIAGVQPADFVDGRSWKSLALGQTPSTWRGGVFLAHEQAGSSAKEGGGGARPGGAGNGPPGGRGGRGGAGGGAGGGGGGGGQGGGGKLQAQGGGEQASGGDAPVPDRFVIGERGNNFPAYVGVRTTRYTYVRYTGGHKELYDNQTDPAQMENIAATASAALLASLDAAVDSLKDCKGPSCRSAEDNIPR